MLLLYHPESDSLFWSKEFVTDGLVEDVTGEEYWHKEAQKRGISQMVESVKAKPLYREMNPKELEQASARLYDAFKLAVKCCPNCEHFKSGKVQCGLNQQTPPPTIIAFGCECFEEVEYIPF
jgi:hypothetical protein